MEDLGGDGLGGGMAIRSGKAPGFTGYFNGTYKVLLPPYRSESILSLFLTNGSVNFRRQYCQFLLSGDTRAVFLATWDPDRRWK